MGTWERVTEWEDEDGDRITSTHRLVFAENGKAFHHVMQWNLVGDERHMHHTGTLPTGALRKTPQQDSGFLAPNRAGIRREHRHVGR